MIKLPDFLIVGCMKSGTSTLSYHLRHHSKVSMPRSELFFFSNAKTYARGLSWYAGHLTDGNPKEGCVIGEKSNSYSYIPESAERIFQAIPKAKLIWVFREPSARTYSNYLHCCSEGLESHSLRYALLHENKRIKRNVQYGYTKRSMYDAQVKCFLNYFPPEQMHYLLFEDLVKNPQQELNKICDFLKIPREPLQDSGQRMNISKRPRFTFLLWITRRLFGRRTKIWRLAKQYCYAGPSRKYPSMDESIRQELLNIFEPHNKELAKLTGLDLSAWNHHA